MSRTAARHALAALLAAVTLLLSPLSVPQAQAAAAWEGTSASAMSAYANRLVAQVNKRRANHHLAALKLAPCVDDFSATWAQYLDANDTFEHADMGVLMRRCGMTWASENLAAWKGSVAPSSIVTTWMKSAAHRQNILSTKARRVGVTVFYDKSRRQFFAVMEFTRP